MTAAAVVTSLRHQLPTRLRVVQPGVCALLPRTLHRSTKVVCEAPGHQQNRHQHQAASAPAQGEGVAEGEQAGGQLQQQSQQRLFKQSQQQHGALQARDRPFSDLLSPWFPGDRTLQQMLHSVDQLFDEFLAPFPMHRRGPLLGSPRARTGTGALSDFPLNFRAPWDVQEADKAYHIRFDLPGMTKEEVSVKVDDDHTLYIHAEHKAEKKEGDVWSSRVQSRYQTSLQLPDDISREEIKAEMKDGVLTLSVPKRAQDDVTASVMDIPIA